MAEHKEAQDWIGTERDKLPKDRAIQACTASEEKDK